MQFTAQIIFPIVNDYGKEGDQIRLGFLTLSQNFRVFKQLFGKVSIGNFNNNRYGLDFSLHYPFKNTRWEVGGNVGYTGSSHFIDGWWVLDEINTFTWSVMAGYFLPKFSLQTNISYGKFLFGDYGARLDCTRLFGETAIGFYFMYSGGEPNGGFHFAIPIPPHKRWKRRIIRIVPLKYFDWEYNAGTEFELGRYYEVRPNENRTEHYFNPNYIQNELLKLN